MNDSAKAGCILFSGEIDARNVGLIQKELYGLRDRGLRNILLGLNSPGANTKSGFALHYGIKASGVNLTAHNIGQVDSSALSIFLAGTKRLACEMCTFTIHRPFARLQAVGYNADQLLEHVGSLKSDEQWTRRILSENTTLSTRQIKSCFESGRTMSATDALKSGIIHDIQPLSIPEDAEISVLP